MASLLNKSYNSYIYFLDNLNNGNTNYEYELLYQAILCLKNNITDKKYVEYFESNLLLPIRYNID